MLETKTPNFYRFLSSTKHIQMHNLRFTIGQLKKQIKNREVSIYEILRTNFDKQTSEFRIEPKTFRGTYEVCLIKFER